MVFFLGMGTLLLFVLSLGLFRSARQAGRGPSGRPQAGQRAEQQARRVQARRARGTDRPRRALTSLTVRRPGLAPGPRDRGPRAPARRPAAARCRRRRRPTRPTPRTVQPRRAGPVAPRRRWPPAHRRRRRPGGPRPRPARRGRPPTGRARWAATTPTHAGRGDGDRDQQRPSSPRPAPSRRLASCAVVAAGLTTVGSWAATASASTRNAGQRPNRPAGPFTGLLTRTTTAPSTVADRDARAGRRDPAPERQSPARRRRTAPPRGPSRGRRPAPAPAVMPMLTSHAIDRAKTTISGSATAVSAVTAPDSSSLCVHGCSSSSGWWVV